MATERVTPFIRAVKYGTTIEGSRLIHVLVLLFVSLFSVTAFASPRTLVRTEDFIVITGSQASGLLGSEVSDLRLFSCRSGKCAPVPVQVDKVDSMDRYVFPTELNSDRDGSRLDDNDEICFMVSDAGDRAPSGWAPEGASRGMEIEIRDPLDQGRGWAYLYELPGKPPPKVPDYIGYRIEGDTTLIESPQFVLGYKTGRISYDMMRMVTPSGGLGADVLDRQRVGIDAQMAGDMNLSLSAPESIIRADDIAVIDGPVRVILDQVVMVEIGTISMQWGTEYFLRYYRSGQNNSVYYEFPVNANAFFKTVLFYWSLDFTPQIIGSQYIDANHLSPLEVTDQARQGIPNDTAHFWWGLYGPEGAVLQALEFDEETAASFTCDGRWKQNPQAVVKRGDEPGRLEIGFGCHEMTVMPEGTNYHWLNYILFPAEPTADGLTDLKNIFEHPLEITVRARG